MIATNLISLEEMKKYKQRLEEDQIKRKNELLAKTINQIMSKIKAAINDQSSNIIITSYYDIDKSVFNDVVKCLRDGGYKVEYTMIRKDSIKNNNFSLCTFDFDMTISGW